MHLFSRFSCLVILLSIARATFASDHAIAARTRTPASEALDPIQTLILQLGSDDYVQRREAESQLIQLGRAAFDYLEDVQDHPDLEIATQSQYLLHRVSIDWAREGDSDVVRAFMSSYDGASGRDRRQIISQLAELENSTGLAALSRISHYELSPETAKHAAISVLHDRRNHLKSAEDVAQTITQEIGNSPRDSAQWLRLYAKQLMNPGTVDPTWSKLVAHETELLAEDSTSTNVSLALGLMQFHIGLCREVSATQDLFEALQAKIEFLRSRLRSSDGNTALALSRLYDKRQDKVADVYARRDTKYINDDVLLIHVIGRENGADNAPLALAMAWILEQREWAVLPLLEAHYAETIKEDRLLLYLAAIARSSRDANAEATKFADRAYNLVAFDLEDRNRLGDVLAEMGHHNWAEREWRLVVDKVPITSTESMIARRSLANWCLHDRGQDKEAAAILAQVCDAFDKKDKETGGAHTDDGNRLFLRSLRTQRDYFLACHMESQQDYASQRRYLDAAHRRDDEDPDVLIAMYRLQNVDDDYRARVEGRIARAISSVEQRIESEPNEPTWYNHYAWLVSNTRGDFEKAIRYSHKSLELRPDTPSYLDTLGRCYYAADDYENAVKYQRRAVDMHPQVQVMRKQLELFEKALASRSRLSN